LYLYRRAGFRAHWRGAARRLGSQTGAAVHRTRHGAYWTLCTIFMA
nr:hypothetical protein [Tanacetum cinerariifolium]